MSPLERARHRVMIVDDHPMILIGLGQLIADEPDLELCAQCSDAAEALPLVESAKPDVIVVDISLKNSSGLNLVRDIKRAHKSARMLVYSMHEELLFAPRAIQAGAMGYVSKHSMPGDIIEAIRKVLRGKVVVSESVSEILLARLTDGDTEPGANPIASLSDRELEVFELLGRGAAVKKIAADLNRSVKTIETHRERIMRKLGASSATELIHQAVEWVLEQDGGRPGGPDAPTKTQE